MFTFKEFILVILAPISLGAFIPISSFISLCKYMEWDANEYSSVGLLFFILYTWVWGILYKRVFKKS